MCLCAARKSGWDRGDSLQRNNLPFTVATSVVNSKLVEQWPTAMDLKLCVCLHLCLM